jgi:small subunit ribosomal protein S17
MKTLTGTVVTLHPPTAMVEVESRTAHPLYKKFVKRTKRFACDCAGLELKVGQEVTIVECRPISKTKHFRVVLETPTEGKTA